MNAKSSASLIKIHAAHEEYVRLLAVIEETTERLLSMLEGPSLDGLDELLAERDELCNQFGPAISSLGAAIRELNELCQNKELAGSSEIRAAREEIDRLHSRHDLLLSKQTICEHLLLARANECRAELAGLSANSQSLNAYSGRQNQSARYLDSRL